MKTAKIRIKNLALRTIIGIKEDERANKQDVIINVCLEVDAGEFTGKDSHFPVPNYRTITKAIIETVENTRFFLLENLTEHVLDLIMKESKVLKATVEVDKPHALRFSESVSIAMSEERGKK